MPKPENIIPYKMKKGQTLNPNGRPRILVFDVIKKMVDNGIKPLTPLQVKITYNCFLNLTSEEIKTIATNPDNPFFVRLISSEMLSGKGYEIVKDMLNRSQGTPTSNSEITVKTPKLILEFPNGTETETVNKLINNV